MNFKKLVIPMALTIALAIAFACRKNKTTNAPANATATPEASRQPEVTAVPGTYFKGSIGTSTDLQMKLVRDGEKLTGSYFYRKVGAKIDLKGTIDKEGNVTLEEFGAGGKQTGVFKGLWKTDNEDGRASIAGNWSKPGGESKTAFSLHEEPISFTGATEIVAKQIKEANKKLNYTIDVEYPEVTGATDNRFAKFNQEAKDLVTKQVAAFKKAQADAAKFAAQAKSPPETPTLSSMASDLSGGYTIAIANDNLISVQYDLGGYSAGAAHNNSSSYALNYDVKADKVLKLAEIFKPDAKYLQAISAYCISDLKKQSKKNGNSLPDDMIQVGAAPKVQNYKSWTVSKKGLAITFDAYQVGPYVAGPQSVLIPYAALKDLIKPDGPIGAFAK
jgi:hypothetical protein